MNSKMSIWDKILIAVMIVAAVMAALIATVSDTPSKRITPKELVKKTDQLITDMQDVAKNFKEDKEYWEIVSKLARVVRDSVRKKPEAMEPFLQDMVDAAVKAGPGLTLRVEDYASNKVKGEMARLRQESGIAQLLEKEKQISALQKEVAQLKAVQEEKDKKIKELKNKLGLSTKKDVPVCLINTWSLTSARFNIINQSTKKTWSIVVLPSSQEATQLPPGEYEIEYCYPNGTLWKKKENVIITLGPSISYDGKWFHGIIRTPN